jgi:predicted RNase H-like HicB family nuclease
MTHRYTVIFEKEEGGGYHVFCPAPARLPHPERDG